MNNKISKLNKLSNKELEDLVLESDSFLDLKRKLGYTSSSGGVAVNIKNRVLLLKLDTSHFTRSKNRRVDNLGNTKYNMHEILIENSAYSNRTSMKKRILDNKLIDYKCNVCNNTGEWLGKSLSLQIDHINGINNDNRIENLRFICPNCHSQTDTFSGKNKG